LHWFKLRKLKKYIPVYEIHKNRYLLIQVGKTFRIIPDLYQGLALNTYFYGVMRLTE